MVMHSYMGKNYLTPLKKGCKPLINRRITRDWLYDGVKGWQTKYKKASDIEEHVKKVLFGRVQFRFTSNHFTDATPPFKATEQGRGGRQEQAPNHDMTSARYIRMYLNTPKFKKLELTKWEMPDKYTPVVTLKELVNAGMHFGHSSSIWNPSMLKYLYDDNNGTHIFDLVQTAASLNRACYYAMEAASKGATFLLLGTKAQAQPIVREAAKRLGMPYCDQRVVGGLISNFFLAKQGIDLMLKLEKEEAQGAWKKLNLDIQDRNTLKLRRLQRLYDGVRDMEFLPDIVILVDELKERCIVDECDRMAIPVIGLVDSNNRPDKIDLPVPGNASSSRCIELFVSKLEDSIMNGLRLLKAIPPGNREVIPEAFDPWLFSINRNRGQFHRSKRQPWHKGMYGTYENFKKARPFGHIPGLPKYREINWNE